MNTLFFDTETTGLPLWREPSDDPRQPHLVQLAALLIAPDRSELGMFSAVIRPDGWTIPDEVAALHGITTEKALEIGIPVAEAMARFNEMLAEAHQLAAHNIDFDQRIMRIAYKRLGLMPTRENLPKIDTCRLAAPLVNLPPTEKMVAAGFDKPKPPKLIECIRHFFGEELEGAHDALVDVRACVRVFFHMQDMKELVDA